ncbi:MAG: hypothetical protein AB7L09_22140 [Nitrospira sp.]
MTDFSALRPLIAKKAAGSKGSTEYGGVEGMIQPPPHDVNDDPHEQMMLIYNTDTAAREEVPLGFDEPKKLRDYRG